MSPGCSTNGGSLNFGRPRGIPCPGMFLHALDMQVSLEAAFRDWSGEAWAEEKFRDPDDYGPAVLRGASTL